MSSKRSGKKLKKRRSKVKASLRKGANTISPDTLRRDLTDPERLQVMMGHLGELLQEEPALQSLRLPAQPLLDALDDLAETSHAHLKALDDPLYQRITILNRTLPGLLNRKFVDRFEKTLVPYLATVKTIPRHFRAVSAGLYFLEIHNRQGGEPGVNPLWNLVFDLSWEAAMASSGDTLSQATGRSGTSREAANGAAPPRSGIDPVSDLAAADPELSDDTIALLQSGVDLIESGRVSLGFALDTVLLGLRAVTAAPDDSDEARVNALRKAFEKEIGIVAFNDLVWGLEYAVEQLDGDQKGDFQTMLRTVQAMPPHENPVVFALYYKSVTEFYKYLKPGESAYAEAIARGRDDVEPMINFGRYLLENHVPKRALNAFIAASEIDPSHEIARLGAGIACWLTESFREARMHWDRAARLWSGYLPESHRDIQLARSLAELDNFAELPRKAYDRFFEESDFNPPEKSRDHQSGTSHLRKKENTHGKTDSHCENL